MTSPNSAFPHGSGGRTDKDSFVNLFINSTADFAPSETASSQSQSTANGMAASNNSLTAASSSVSYSVVSVADSPSSQSHSDANVADAAFGQPQLRMPSRPALLVKPLGTDMQTMPLAALASPKKEEVDLFSSSTATQQQSQVSQVLLEECQRQESNSSLLDILNSPAPTSNQPGGSDAADSIHTWAAVQHDLGKNVASSPSGTSSLPGTAERTHRDRPPSRPPSPSKQAAIPSWATAPFRPPSSDPSSLIPPDRIGTLSPPRSSAQPNQSSMTVPLLVGSTPRPQSEYQLSTSPPPMTPLGDAQGNSHSDNSDNDEDDEDEEDRNTDANTSTEPTEKPNPRKKKKNIYPPEARKMLHEYFQNVSRNPNKQQRMEMVALVGSNEKTIRIWFQNQRQKLAKLERRRIARINGLQPTLADLTAPGMPILPAPPKNTSMDSLQSGNFLQTATPASFHGSTYQMPAHPPPTPGLPMPMPPPPTPGFPMNGNTLSSQMQMQQIHQQHVQQHFQQQQQQQQQQHPGGQTATYVTRAGIISPVTPTFLQNQAAAAAVAAAHAQQQSQGNSPHFIHLHHSNFNTGGTHQPFLTHPPPSSTSPTRFGGFAPGPAGVSPPLASPAMHLAAGPGGGAHLSQVQATLATNTAAAYPSPDFVPSTTMPPPTPPAHMHLHHHHAQHHVPTHFSPASVLGRISEATSVTPAFDTLHLATASPSPQVLQQQGGAGGHVQQQLMQHQGHVSALGFAPVGEQGPPTYVHQQAPWAMATTTPSPPAVLHHHAVGASNMPGPGPAAAGTGGAGDYFTPPPPPPPQFASGPAIQQALFPSEPGNVDASSYMGTATGDWASLVQGDTVSMASSISMMSSAPALPVSGVGTLAGGGSKLAAHVMTFATGDAGDGVGHQQQQQGQLQGQPLQQPGGYVGRGHMQ
ncbi:hypothetical protein BCR44DRAFT_52075 [Catenaria anguillulae PL171]|uniref:Homeobox domain-containing protein n=1 Tax=Catenaria anguillulae PL171 TaxID=765915 RepID=A0A1Y2I3L8_9FUNG|nr:hypothetical protein BCR44DRAFT_52075 [Catenaria anguillulae PL171]